MSENKRHSLIGTDAGALFNSNLRCLDDEINTGINDLLDDNEQFQGNLLQSGDFFGGVSVGDVPARQITKLYMTVSGCQIVIFSQRVALIDPYRI